MDKKTESVLVACLAIVLSTNAWGIGVSPGTIEVDNMVRGGYAQKLMAISTAGDKDLVLEIESSGGIKDWITFELVESPMTLPKKSVKPVLVRINVPNEAQDGDYEGDIVISTLYHGEDLLENVSGAMFMPGLIVKVRLKVTGKEMLSYEIKSISAKNTERNYPVEFTVHVRNTGNVVAIPRLNFTVVDSETNETFKGFNYTGEEVLPTTSKQFVIKMQTRNMSVGDYYAKVVSDMGEEHTVFFGILKPGGYLILNGTLESISLSNTVVRVGERVEVDATFTNNCNITIESAKINGKIYILDPAQNTKELISVFEGDSASVPVGEKVTLTGYFTPEKTGRYSIESTVVYSGRETDVKNAVLLVREASIMTVILNSITLMLNDWKIQSTGIILLLVLIFYLKKRKTAEAQQ